MPNFYNPFGNVYFIKIINKSQNQPSFDSVIFIKPHEVLLRAVECFGIPSLSQEIQREAKVFLKINRDRKNISEISRRSIL